MPQYVNMDVAEKVEQERDQLRIQLEAWQSIFGTSQLSHAHARLEAAESQVDRSKLEVDELREDIRRLRGERRAQRQDSLDDQLRDVLGLATQAGCYDAADFIRNRLKSETPEPEDTRTHGEG